METLKPCPFCGSYWTTVKRGKFAWWVKCEGCGTESGCRMKKTEAIEAWNRRAYETD